MITDKYRDEIRIIEKIKGYENLTDDDLLTILESENEELIETLRKKAYEITDKYYGNRIFIRGLIEFSNYCKENCYYCGIGYGNSNVKRFRLTEEEIINAAEKGYGLGFRTFVLQGGEDLNFTDEVFVRIIREIKNKFPDTRITLSLGVKEKESLIKLREAGADRYLIRHETANADLFSLLHPQVQSLKRRKQMLYDLKETGFVTGTGFLIGAPYSKLTDYILDFRFIEELKPEMIGVGPFIPQSETRFKDFPHGDLKLTLKIVSLLRYMNPTALIPSTTALNTIDEKGRIYGILHGANVVMPNLSPDYAKANYKLYNKKAYNNLEAAEHLEKLGKEFEKIGKKIVIDTGDPVKGE